MHPYLRLELVLEADGAGKGTRSPQIPSPLLRRMLGKALVERFCPFASPLCEARASRGSRPSPPRERCGLADCCPYGVLFASSLTSRPPYALYVPPARGEAAVVELTLFGPAWPLYPWALRALRDALQEGLGRRRQSWTVGEVRRVRPDRTRERLGGAELADLSPASSADLLGLGIEPCPTRPLRVLVELLSPARLLRTGRLLPGREPVPFRLLIARILDRFSSLYGAQASDVLRPEIRAVVESEAARVPLLRDETRWVEVADFSARSRTAMLLGGKVGRLLYGPEAAPFLPVLRAGELLHVGKNAAAGCGRIRVDVLSGVAP